MHVDMAKSSISVDHLHACLQGMGLMIGAIFMDFERSLVAASVVMLAHMLLGGFYVQNLPFWLQWAQYAAYTSYSFKATLELGFRNLELR